ncbi:MAG: TIGR02147 family protein [Methylotenera sp.]|nr:TIGR02147 family protein [Oligoflexia bacterium]
MHPSLEKNTPLQRSPADFLRDLFKARRERNPHYSSSAFARDLGMSSSLLSRIFGGSRPVSLKLAMQISTALDLVENESNAFILSVIQNSSRNAKISKRVRAKIEQNLEGMKKDTTSTLYTTVEIERFKAMASWHHLAILNLVTLDEFESNPNWMAKQLGISTLDVQDAIERMLAIGLLSENEGVLSRAQKNFYVRTNRSEVAVRKFHDQMISKASAELKRTDDADFHSRLINGITFTCGEEHIEVIKEKIDRFEDEILALVSTGSKKSVYQMNVQFFPLTKNKKKES